MTQNNTTDDSFSGRVRSAVFWRSGSQILSQTIMWASTLFVIRILEPADYGLFAMTQVILVLLSFLNGYSFAASLVRGESLNPFRMRQAFGMLLLLNGGLAIAQLCAAPLVAEYYRQPEVADIMRVQALLYLATPFIALPDAVLSRSLDFRSQAKANFACACAGAITALVCALSGQGVWTLVYAALALSWTKAITLSWVSGVLVRPSFNFKGAGAMFGFGGALLISNLFWIILTQADIFIAGRSFDPHALGLYAEALFLTQIFVCKFIPPLNDVAFPAYSRLQHDKDAFAWSFTKAVRIIMLAALPFYFGMAVAAKPLILIAFGQKWAEIIPLVQILALAMPFMTLHILIVPAVSAMGRPSVNAYISIAGAFLMITAFLIGVDYGPYGLAYAWLGGFPVFILISLIFALPILGVTIPNLGRAIAPGLCAAVLMALIVKGVDMLLPPLSPLPHLTLLVATGAMAYIAMLFLFARATLDELFHLVFKRPVYNPA